MTETCSPKCRSTKRRVPLADRIWSKVDRDTSPDGCWPWLGKISRNGYGLFSTAPGRFKTAHRAVWEVANGRPLVSIEVACHICDNPRCVRPSHVFIGTQTDNMRDMHSKMRHSHGEHVPGSKLTADQVRDIRRRYWSNTATQGELAREHGLNRATIWSVVHRRTWKHVG
jgi:hypothetical protein